MTEESKLANEDRCEVVAGTHRGKHGVVEDMKISKTGAVTITCSR
ncbi:hypothetical protein [Microbacterium panaciterrae]